MVEMEEEDEEDEEEETDERWSWQNWDAPDGGWGGQESEKRPFACPICRRRYGTLSGIIAHQRNARSPIRPYHCTICDKTFALVGHRDRHILSKHRPYQKLFVCELCKKRYARRNSLLAHSLRLHRSTPSSPSSPSSTTSWRPYVRSEKKKKKKGVAVVVCEICNGLFSRWRQLVEHNSQCHTRRDDFPEVTATEEADYVSLETLLELDIV